MQKDFDEQLIRNSRLIICPSCDSEFRVGLDKKEFLCESCEEEIDIEEEGYPEEFVWHPKREF